LAGGCENKRDTEAELLLALSNYCVAEDYAPTGKKLLHDALVKEKTKFEMNRETIMKQRRQKHADKKAAKRKAKDWKAAAAGAAAGKKAAEDKGATKPAPGKNPPKKPAPGKR